MSKSFPRESSESSSSQEDPKEGAVSLADCIDEFEKPEKLED